jgi:transcriptional regulator of acetoin/glycerol metabolism
MTRDRLLVSLEGPPTPSLERRRVLDRAWHRYVVEGRDPAGLRPEILRSWRRAKEEHRIDPRLAQPIRSLSLDGLEERRREDAVLAVASPILEDFASSLKLSGHVLAYLDGDGWMLTVDGDRAVLDRLSEIEVRPGANWAEESAATNAAGTALVEGRALEVFASEHYAEAWQPWSCAAAPIHAPGEPRPVGIIEITGPWEMRGREALPLARAIARAVQERLRAVVRVRDEVVRHCVRAARENGGAVVGVDARGRVLAANGAAVRWRIVEAGVLAPDLRDALANGLASRFRAPADEFVIPWPEGGAVVAAPVRYGAACIGAILRKAACGKGGHE